MARFSWDQDHITEQGGAVFLGTELLSGLRVGEEARRPCSQGRIARGAQSASLAFGCPDFARGLLLFHKLECCSWSPRLGVLTHAKAILFCIARGPWQADRKLLGWDRELTVK